MADKTSLDEAETEIRLQQNTYLLRLVIGLWILWVASWPGYGVEEQLNMLFHTLVGLWLAYNFIMLSINYVKIGVINWKQGTALKAEAARIRAEIKAEEQR